MVDKYKINRDLDLYFKLESWGKWTIADDGKVSSNTGAHTVPYSLTEFPVEFDHIGGSFNCAINKLVSLKNGPRTVKRDFICSDNKLTSLEGAPEQVGGRFWCTENPLESLKGLPETIGRDMKLDYSPSLPLLRLLTVKSFWFSPKSLLKYPYAKQIADVLEQFAGQGKRGVLDCSKALLTLEKELGKDIRLNIRW